MVDNIKTVGVPLVGTRDMSNKISIHDKRAPMKGSPTQYKHNRCSLRLKHYDYSCTGYYFITICTQNREHLFGEIVDGVMGLNVAGEMVHTLWYAMKDDFPDIALHEFIIMPNHIHGIIEIKNNENDFKSVGVPLVGTLGMVNSDAIHDSENTVSVHDKKAIKRAPTRDAPTVGDVVGAFKSKTTNTYIKMVKNGTLPPFNKRIWQRNYYEHIIRDKADYERVATYTINNPTTWHKDTLNT